MLHGSNTAAAAMLLVLCAMVMTPPGRLRAQPAPPVAPAPPAPPSSPAPTIEAPRVDWAVGREVHGQIEAWVRAGKVARQSGARPLLVSQLVGVRVTLRSTGLPVAMGDAMSNAASPQAAVDLREAAARATELALLRYRERLEKARQQSPANDEGPARPPRPPQPPQPVATIDETGPLRLEVDLQIGHGLTEIRVPQEAAAKAAMVQFAAGHHGLKLTHHQNPALSAYQWPATALAANVQPESAINQLLADVGYPTDQLLRMTPLLAKANGPKLQRFEVIHLVRASDKAPLTQLTRGNELIPLKAIDTSTVADMGRRLVEHLSRRVVPAGAAAGSVTGIYQPTSDRYEQPEATIADSAMVAYAMSRRAAYLATLDPKSLEYLNTREKARPIVDYVRRNLVPDKAPQIDPQARALLLMTLTESPHLTDLRAERDRLGAMLAELPAKDGLFLHPATMQPLSRPTQAIILAALTSLYEQTRQETLRPIIEASMNVLWGTKMSDADVLAAVPWMTGAFARMHRLSPAGDEKANALWQQRADLLRHLAQTLRRNKLIKDHSPIDPDDVLGGYDLANDAQQGAADPDWRTALVLSFIVQASTEPVLVKDENPLLLRLDTILSVRFLAQLMFDESACFYVRGNRKDVIDGVRLSLTDNRLDARASAMALLAVTQLQESLTGRK